MDGFDVTITPYPTMLPGQKLAAGTVNQITTDINALQGVAGSAAAAEAAADAAEAAQAAAEAAEVAAEAAVTAALGPVELTNVAGTDTAYTADCSHDNAANRSFWFTPHLDGGVAPTLSINGGTARQLRTETGGVLSALLLRGGVGYLIRSTGTTFNVLGLRLTQRWQSRLMLVGSSATVDFYDTDGGSVVGRISCDSTGRMLLATNGSTALELQADGDVKAPVRYLTSTNREVYHLDNPPDFDWNDVGEIGTTTEGPGDENIIEALVATDTTPIQPTGADLNRRGWVNVNNGWVDFDGLPKHASFEVGIGASKVVNLYTGTATNWNGRTSNVVQVTGPAIVRASTFQEDNDIAITASLGSLSDVVGPTIPVYGRTWVIAGQSWIKRAGKGGRAGIMATYRALADAMPATRIIDGAVGASGLFVGADGEFGEDGETDTDTSNAYWDVINDEPGPNAEILRDAILDWLTDNPTQPFPEAVIWNYGLPDLNVIAATGDYTPAAWTQGQTDLQAWLDAELTTALGTTVELNHIMCVLPARKLGVWSEDKWYPLRRAQLDVITTAPRTFRGPDIYDAVRMWNDGHHGFAMQKRWGSRWPYFIENALRSATHYTGPRITDVHEISSSEYWVRIERGYVSTGVTASLTRPAQPAGFGLLPAGSDYFATRVDVARYSWTTDDNPGGDPLDDDILVISPRTAASGLRPVFMYGSGYETAQPSRIIRDLRTFMPLQIK